MIIRASDVQPFAFGSLIIRDYDAGSAASSSIAIIAIPMGARHPEAYSTASDKFYVVLSGILQFTLDESGFELREGDLCIVERSKRFSYVNTSPDMVRVLLVHTPPFDSANEVILA